MVDDLWSGEERGFQAHLSAGSTTGVLKLVGIPAYALVRTRSLSGALLVALAANVLNQLDTRPGRALKAFALASIAARPPRRALATAVLLAPYDEGDAVGERIQVHVPEVHVGATAATTLALVVHELATNSLKYGALSVVGGTLDVSCATHDGDAVLVWTERGGPPVTAPTRPAGFGSRLVSQSVSGQLGGSIVLDWLSNGVVATVRMSKARLAT